MTNMSGDMADTWVADLFVAKIWSGERVHQCLDATMPQRWSGPDPRSRWKLTPMITASFNWANTLHTEVKMSNKLGLIK